MEWLAQGNNAAMIRVFPCVANSSGNYSSGTSAIVPVFRATWPAPIQMHIIAYRAQIAQRRFVDQ
jgi:hypothetical protein